LACRRDWVLWRLATSGAMYVRVNLHPGHTLIKAVCGVFGKPLPEVRPDDQRLWIHHLPLGIVNLPIVIVEDIWIQFVWNLFGNFADCDAYYEVRIGEGNKEGINGWE
jgi:hypothetical protein